MMNDLERIQRRINQTILLRQVFDTHYCPSSLMPGDTVMPSKKAIETKLKRRKQSILSRKLTAVYGEKDDILDSENSPEKAKKND